MTRKPRVGLALFYGAALAIAVGTSAQSLAQTKGGGGRQAKPAPRTPVNCVIVMQYDPDRGDKERRIAFNYELMASADAVAGNLSKQETDAKSGVETHKYTVDKKHNFTKAFDFFGHDPKDKKIKTCCKRIEIVGHGHTDGSLDLPYNNNDYDKASDKLSDAEQKEAGADSLGGKYKDLQAGSGAGPRWFKRFTDEMKAALCPEIKEAKEGEEGKEANADDKPAVVFDSCYTAKEGSGIADQVHDATGVKTAGFTHTCDFPYDEGAKKAASLPVPRKGTSSEYKEFKEKAKNDDGSGMYVPGTPGRGGATTANVAYDRTEWCKFGPAAKVAMTLIPTDEQGNPVTPTIPVADNTPTTQLADTKDDKSKDEKTTDADKSASDDSGVVLKGDENWTWDPKGYVYINKKDPNKKLPVPKTVKKGQMWDPDGDPEGLSPIEPETSGNSRTYRDPKTGKNILVQYVDGETVYESDDHFDQDGKTALLKRKFNRTTGKLEQRDTIDPKTGVLTQEFFDNDGKLTGVSTIKDNHPLTKEDYQDGKLIKRTTFKDGEALTEEEFKDGKILKRTSYWPGTDKVQKVEDDFDGGKPKKTTDYPLVPEPATPSVKTATEPQQPDTVQVFDKTTFKGKESGSALPTETLALLYPKPDLPGTGTRETRDKGFDRDPAKCTTNAEGRCEIKIQQDDRELYGLATSSKKPNHYRLEFNTLQHSGGVAETTGKGGKRDLSGIVPADGRIAVDEFKIGGRSYTRLGFDQPSDGDQPLIERASRALDAKVEKDLCERTKPALAGDMQPTSFSAINNALPAATIKLRRAEAFGRQR